MTVSKTKHGWRAEVFHGGKRIANKSGFGRRSEAVAWHDAEKRAAKEGPAPKAMFEELLTYFRAWHMTKVRPGTRRRYEVDIVYRIEPHFRGWPLADITPKALERFAQGCMTTLSPKSVNNCLHTLRAMLNKAVKWKLIKESPYGLESLAIPEQPYVWWDEEDQIHRFLEAAKASRYYALYFLAIETGLRYGELAGLSPADFDLERGVIHVHRQWNEREHCYSSTKHGRERWVDYNPEGELGKVIGALVAERLGEGRLFVTATGAPITKSGVAHKFFRAVIRRAGLPVVPFHSLRHSMASWYMRSHDDVWALKEILGHSDIRTTQRYAHQSKRARRKPLDLASITQNSRNAFEERGRTMENERGKEWRDGRDSNPRASKIATAG